MPLTECSECGEQVSSKAEACPSCGAPVSPDKKNVLTRNRGCGDIFIFGGLVLLVALLFALGSC